MMCHRVVVGLISYLQVLLWMNISLVLNCEGELEADSCVW